MVQEKLRSLDDIFPGAKAEREQMADRGRVFAQKYLVFQGATADRRAAELFTHWKNMIRRAKVNKSDPLELAAHNALREWIEGIDAQIEFATTGDAPEWIAQ